ncbi:unnamed protein product, partial [Ixodes hexagonus]
KPDKKYCFLAEWKDASTDTVRHFILNFFTKDSTVEMYDIKTRRIFLRRTECEDCSLADFYVGSVISILSRHLKITGYADAQTETFLSPQHERTVLLVKPTSLHRLGDIWSVLEAMNATVCKALMLKLTANDLDAYQALRNDNDKILESGLLEGTAVCLQLLGERILARLKNRMTVSLDPSNALGCHCWVSKDEASAEKEARLFFGTHGDRLCSTAVFEDTTCCVIKPHVFRDGVVHKVLGKILTSGFDITALQMFHLDGATAEEFLEVYKGIVSDYKGMVHQLSSGPCLVLEVRGCCGPETPRQFKELAGPSDPFYACKLYPGSLRAAFGKDNRRNVVHCTDVPEDARLEVRM